MSTLRAECVRLAIAAGAGNDAINMAKQIESFISSPSSASPELHQGIPHKCPASTSESVAHG